MAISSRRLRRLRHGGDVLCHPVGLGAGPGQTEGVAHDLIPIAGAVDELGRLRGGGIVWSVFDDIARLDRIDVPSLGDSVGDLLGQGVDQRLHVAALGRRHGIVEEAVGRTLVFLPPVKARLDPELVQDAAEEGRLQRRARQMNLAGRLQQDLACRRRQHIVAVGVATLAEILGEGDDGLSGAAERRHRVGQLLSARQVDSAGTEPQQQHLHPVVLPSLPERFQGVVHRHGLAHGSQREGVRGQRLHQAIGKVEGQDHALGRRSRSQLGEVVQAEDDAEHGRDEQRADNSA